MIGVPGPRKCMKLMTADIPGERGHRVDVCGEDAGHEGGHRGKYAGITTKITPHGETIDQHGRQLTYGDTPDPGVGPRNIPGMG